MDYRYLIWASGNWLFGAKSSHNEKPELRKFSLSLHHNSLSGLRCVAHLWAVENFRQPMPVSKGWDIRLAFAVSAEVVYVLGSLLPKP